MQTQYKTIILLLISIISAGLAQGLSIIAIPWYFTDNLNQSSFFSLGYGIITFFGLFWGLYAGVMIDNFNRKKILLYINLCCACVFGGIYIYFKFINGHSPIIILLGFGACSLYYMIFFPNLYAITQELTNKKDYVKVNSLIELFIQTISIIAATICGLLLAGGEEFVNYFNLSFLEFKKWDIRNLFLLNSILYLITFTLLMFVDYQPRKNLSNHNLQKTLQDIREAVSFLIGKKNILIYGVASQIVFAFLIVELFSLLPIFVKNCLNENVITFSLADVTYGFGALIAGLITTKTLKKSNKIDFTILLIMTAGYSFFLMIKFPNLNMFFASTFIIGVVNASIRITRMSYFFDTIPNNLIGRINTIFNSVNTLIRGVLILIFSMTWFAEGSNVIMGYKIGIYILILFTLPLMLMKKQKLN